MTSRRGQFILRLKRTAGGINSIIFSDRIVLGLAACALLLGLAACSAGTETPRPIVAVLSRLDNQVYISTFNQKSPSPATTGLGLSSGTTITTGEQSDAVIDLSVGNAAYLESNTAVTLLRLNPAGQGTEADLRLDAGRLLVIMPAGRVHVATLLAQIDLVGGAGMVDYKPGTVGLEDGVFMLSCLAQVCTVNSRVFGGDLARNEQLTITGSGLAVARAQLSADQVTALLDELQYGASVAATLAAWPAGAATEYAVTPTPPEAATVTALPSRTLAPIISTATPTSLPSATATLEPVSRPSPTATRRTIPRATRTATSTTTPSETLLPPTLISKKTDQPQIQPHSQPSATPPPSPTTIPPSQTPLASATPVPPSATLQSRPTKTPPPKTPLQ